MFVHLCFMVWDLGPRGYAFMFPFWHQDPITGSRQNLDLFDFTEHNRVAVNLTYVLQ